MSVVETWRAFIKAQEIYVNQYAEPFTISFKKKADDELLLFQIHENSPLDSVRQIIRQAFPGINDDDIRLEDGYLLYDSTSYPQISKEILSEAETNYLELDPTPCFTGTIHDANDPFLWLGEEIGLKRVRYGECFATLNEINTIDIALKERPSYSRLPALGAIFKIRPSQYYISRQSNLLCEYFAKVLDYTDYIQNEISGNVIVRNIFLNDLALNFISNNTAFKKSYHRIIFKIEENAFVDFLKKRYDLNIYFAQEDDQGDKTGIILPDPKNSSFHLLCNSSITLSDLRYRIFHFRTCLRRYFALENISIEHQHIFQIDLPTFYNNVEELLDQDVYSFNSEKGIIGFDFATQHNLDKQIENIKSLKILDVDYKGDNHRFKVRIDYNSPLNEIATKLREIPAIKTKLSNDRRVLTLFCSFDDISLINQLRARIADTIDSLHNPKLLLRFDNLQEGKVMYHINFGKEEFDLEIKNRFAYLKGEDISIYGRGRSVPFGTIVKLDYPLLTINPTASLPDGLDTGDPISVCCELRGERDKIRRLSNTIDIIFSSNSAPIPNRRLKDILIDSSKATSISKDIRLTEKYKETLESIESSLLSNVINQRQKEAIAKCLMAKDFFIIQGPPGTGKSTAIAELIWQHIRTHNVTDSENYRILVSSETNLAVDNALDKLRSNDHLLIKPIRLGAEDKLDKEGRRFSLEAINRWKLLGTSKSQGEIGENNIVQDWIIQVGKRSLRRKLASESDWSTRWMHYLSQQDTIIRELFCSAYIKNANVIGATCSSIGKLNAQNRFTRFFLEYAAVCFPKELQAFNSGRSISSSSSLKAKPIQFNLVVQDEASKASPPELALPCLFGKKAVVIGDHRQLPPMVDTNEFIDSLSTSARKSKVKGNKEKIDELVQFIKRNREEFSISHFEKLFKRIDPNLKSTFNTQYRMHPAINDTIRQFYVEDGGLDCGIPEDIANSPDMSHPLNRYHGITANKNTHVVWLNTPSPEIKSGTSRVNYGEIEAIDWLLGFFKKSPGYKRFIAFWDEQMEQKQIGIITFYSAQANLLSKLKLKYPELSLRVSPVDRFQGMERNIIIVSLVRSNSVAQHPSQPPDLNNPLYNEDGYIAQESLGFAESPNRLNVALSRAKRLLIVVGNAKHFTKHPIYKRVYETIQKSAFGSVKDYESFHGG